jgi:hypothetical protein
MVYSGGFLLKPRSKLAYYENVKKLEQDIKDKDADLALKEPKSMIKV